MMFAMLALGQSEPVWANTDQFVTVPEHRLRPEGQNIRFEIRDKTDFDEAIPSWTAQTPGDSSIVVWLGPSGDHEYCLGRWGASARTSVNQQKDDMGSVDTDTLNLAQPTTRLQVRIQLVAGSGGEIPQVTSFHLILRSASRPDTERDALKSQWGRWLEPPRRAQSSYPGGEVLCSPTSVSMSLGYWAKLLNRPFLDHDVPEVQRGVYDPAWKGTGNWPFNVAFAGSLPGMTGYVTRFRDIRDIEEWIAHDVPVITSVSYGLLKGHGKVEPNDGHLVLLVGFDSDGNPLFNDPGRNVVRRGYKREDFLLAWRHSKKTVYLIYPKLWQIPRVEGPWESRS